MDKVNESIISAGFGGQGVMVLGKFFAIAGMLHEFKVTWLPSYGAEVRGGTAHSYVRISSNTIANPAVFNPDTAIVMNAPSLDKFEKRVKSGGLLILNSSMAVGKPKRNDIKIIEAPLTDEAIKIGNVKIANIITAGIYASRKRIFEKDILKNVIKTMLRTREELVSVNLRALELGMEIGKE
ncbi:MAG: 2-oxoacid:acceptor oxidoreductase family protein [Candidatus Omnitrophica bacterium]|nr:2-oxoacid:acceptor oxidoreductase family protein [Candidatus Omnitrophota bacterium]MBU1128884.1 2-oxoacid:acceptor oxidoreductase family protein [Candidatus Omnitrophota bacterium]MBU1784471.1 2-oxoacid:acceptor oxidoreductase family protein [Candidatus Omnitrophota bacterium]MBU1851939.1 2-oxoacid:acceptor oxidoreductase family protein [Candidatus Omnitrophota bacterium]